MLEVHDQHASKFNFGENSLPPRKRVVFVFFFCCVLTGFSLVGGGGVCVHVMYVCMYTHMHTHRSAVASYKDTNAVGSRPHPSASFDSASLEALFK